MEAAASPVCNQTHTSQMRTPLVRLRTFLRDGDFSNGGAQGSSPKQIGAVGGNVGLVDGSVNWKAISQMKRYRGWSSQLENECWALW